MGRPKRPGDSSAGRDDDEDPRIVDAEGRPVRLALTAGQAGDAPVAPGLLEVLAPGAQR